MTGRDGEKVVYGDYAGSDVYRGKPFLLRPIPNSSEKVKFAVVNDIHEDSQRLSDLLSRAPKDIEFLVLNGDMLSRMDSERQIFEGFMNEIVKFTRSEMPVYFARGNHETRGEFSEEFLKYFPTPTGKPYYSFKWGNACFVMLDAGEDKPDSDIEYFSTTDFDAYRREQAEWFAELIKNEDFKKAPVKIMARLAPFQEAFYAADKRIRRGRDSQRAFTLFQSQAEQLADLSCRQERHKCPERGQFQRRFNDCFRQF